MQIVIGITGASGVIYGIELLRACKDLGVTTHLVMSDWAQSNIRIETNYSVEEIVQLASYHYDNRNLGEIIASGSFCHQGMIVVPCSMKTLAAIACGYSDSLLTRAADVTLKEKRKLVLVVRETPLNSIHLENMLTLSKIGVVIMPPVPAMYSRPKSIRDLVLHTVGRVLDQFGIKNSIVSRWDPGFRSG